MGTEVMTSEKTQNPMEHEIASCTEWLQCTTQRRPEGNVT